MAREAAAVAKALDAAPVTPAKRSRRDALRLAATEVLAEWDDRDNHQYGLPQATERLRAALAGKPDRGTQARTPRTGTKQEAVLALLRRPEGAIIAQIMDATTWQSHTVRGFLAGLKKKGIQVEVLDRVRQVSPGKDGAKGSCSIYRIASVG